jgi:hypothetical protein
LFWRALRWSTPSRYEARKAADPSIAILAAVHDYLAFRQRVIPQLPEEGDIQAARSVVDRTHLRHQPRQPGGGLDSVTLSRRSQPP